MRSLVLVILINLVYIKPVAGDSLKVASWNIYWLSNHGNNMRTPEDYKRLRAIANELDADIVALQEVDDGLIENVFDSDRYRIEISTRPRAQQQTALVIRKTLSYRRKPDYKELDVGSVRYGTVAEVSVGSVNVEVMSVHMKSSCFSNQDDSSTEPKIQNACAKLKEQVPILEAWLDTRIANNQPFVLLGDFNRRLAQAGDDIWSDLSDGATSPLLLTTAGEKPQCWNGYYREFIDHIILGPSSSKWMVSGSFSELVFDEAKTSKASQRRKWSKKISDHCPIAVTLDIQ